MMTIVQCHASTAVAQALDRVPVWMAQGFEAALFDPTPGMVAATVRLPFSVGLARTIPPGERTRAVIDRVLPLLVDADAHARSAVVELLAVLPLGERTDAVIDRLVPLLGDTDDGVRWRAGVAL